MADRTSAGVDLAVTAASKVVVEEDGEVSAEWQTSSTPEGFRSLVEKLAGLGPMPVVMEATAMSWFMLAVAVARWGRGLELFRVSGTKAAALRFFYRTHCQTDRIDARMLARMPHVDPALKPLELPDREEMALRRLTVLRHRLIQRRSAIRNRLRALLRWERPGVLETTGGKLTEGLVAVLGRWPDLRRLASAQAGTIAKTMGVTRDQAEQLRGAARQAVAFYEGYVDFDGLALEVELTVEELGSLQQQISRLDAEIRARHTRRWPNDVLVTIPGIGSVVAATVRAVIGTGARFGSAESLRAFTGLVSRERSSGQRKRGGRITKAGPGILRWALYMAADTARQRDPTLAALYWRLRHKGHHHTSATVAVANHLVSRIHAVLRDDRPYVFQDLDGDQIDRQDAYRIAQSLRPEQPPPHKEGPPSAPQNEETNEAQPFTHHTLIEEAKRLIRT